MHNMWQKFLSTGSRSAKTPIIALAPMAGYTDSAFRLLCLKSGADVVYTEMVSVEALWRKNERTLKMLKLLPGEKNVILQLFGNQPESFAKALELIPVSDYSGIDINFGCPARKVFKTGAGAALMDNKKTAREIIQTTLKNTSLPVSIKIRSQVKNISAVEFVKFISDLPISAVMIHGRSLAQGFAGEVDYKMIYQVKKLLPNIPVLANGGVYTTEDAKNLLNKTGADGIGIARGALGNPWVFKKIKDFFALSESEQSENEPKGLVTLHPTRSQIHSTILQHAKYFLKYSNDLEPLRKHLLHYFKAQKNASQMRQKIIKVKTLDDLKKALN